MKRRHFLLFAAGINILGMGGCSWLSGLTMRSQSPDEPKPDAPARLVGDMVVPFNTQPARVDAVGLITGLHGTGSDPNPSPQRAALLEEMQLRGVRNPNTLLASGDVAMVMLQGILRPGIQQGDHFDIEVRVPTQNETTSLRGGFLLETRLTESAVLSNRLHHGNLLALAKGPVMVDPAADSKKDRVLMCRGRVLGGGVALKSRPLGLVLTPGHQNVLNSSRVATAVNRRFHTFQKGVKSGMAKSKTNEFIELAVHPRYKDNIARYIQVVSALAISESATERTQRIASLKDQLLNAETAADAALQLEAIGPDGADTLLKGITSKDPEVQFYSAEALAYLDRREAAAPLGQIAREQPAFRVFALTALSVMQDYAAYEQLQTLLSVPSAETRYGAFRALWTMNENDPLVKGESLGGQFNYHVLSSPEAPMIHVTRTRLAEIVVFGADPRFLTPLAVSAGNEIMVTSEGGDQVCVSKYTIQDGDQKRTVSTRVDDIIRAVVELGGTYPDVVQALQEAKTSGALLARLEVDALPEAGRSYDRVVQDGHGQSDQGGGGSETKQHVSVTPARPAPELFYRKSDKSSSQEGDDGVKSAEKSASNADSDDKSNTKKGFFARIFGRE
jgi:flagellar basal body P-ring protein FlgI